MVRIIHVLHFAEFHTRNQAVLFRHIAIDRHVTVKQCRIIRIEISVVGNGIAFNKIRRQCHIMRRHDKDFAREVVFAAVKPSLEHLVLGSRNDRGHCHALTVACSTAGQRRLRGAFAQHIPIGILTGPLRRKGDSRIYTQVGVSCLVERYTVRPSQKRLTTLNILGSRHRDILTALDTHVLRQRTGHAARNECHAVVARKLGCENNILCHRHCEIIGGLRVGKIPIFDGIIADGHLIRCYGITRFHFDSVIVKTGSAERHRHRSGDVSAVGCLGRIRCSCNRLRIGCIRIGGFLRRSRIGRRLGHCRFRGDLL